MSRSYEFKIMVRGFKRELIKEIGAALIDLWDFDPGDFPGEDEALPEQLDACGVDNLTGGTTDDEMAAQLAHAVWAANGAYCEVEVWSRFLDVVPPEDVHTWTEGDYQEWLQEQGRQGADDE